MTTQLLSRQKDVEGLQPNHSINVNLFYNRIALPNKIPFLDKQQGKQKMTDNYSGERLLETGRKITPVGENDHAGKDKGFSEERIGDNPPVPLPLEGKLKTPDVSASLEKKCKLWSDQRGNAERIRKRLEEILSYTTGMASLAVCARLLGINAFLRSTSDKECLSMIESLFQAIVDGAKEAADTKDKELPSIKIKLEVE